MRFRSIDFEKLLDEDQKIQLDVKTTKSVNCCFFICQLSYNLIICAVLIGVFIFLTNTQDCCTSDAFNYPISCDSNPELISNNTTVSIKIVVVIYFVLSVFGVIRCIYGLLTRAKSGWRKYLNIGLNVLQVCMNLMFFVVLVLRWAP